MGYSNGVCPVSKTWKRAFSIYQTHTYFYLTILINLWTMSIQMNGPHTKTALSYTFIFLPVKARIDFSSKTICIKKLIRYFSNGNFPYYLSNKNLEKFPL